MVYVNEEVARFVVDLDDLSVPGQPVGLNRVTSIFQATENRGQTRRRRPSIPAFQPTKESQVQVAGGKKERDEFGAG